MTEHSLPPLNWLRAFESSARQLSFTRAAEELHMTQPAVSQQIKSLENYLRRDLFIRKPRALQLTEAGRSYLPIVQEAFVTLGQGTRALTGGSRTRGQTLNLQCNMAFSTFWLAPRMSDLLEQYPWMTVNVANVLWHPEQSASASDLEIRFGKNMQENSECVRLAHEQYFPVCAPQLKSEACLDHSLFDCVGMTGNWSSWFEKQNSTLPPDKHVHLASTFAFSFAAAEAGNGFAMAHSTIAQSSLKTGSLVAPFESSYPMPEAYFLLKPAAHAQTPATEAFTQWIYREFGLGS